MSDDSRETVSLSAKGGNAIGNLRSILAGYNPENVVQANVEFVIEDDDSEADDEADTADESTGQQSASSNGGVDSSRNCPQGGTIKHAVMEMLARANDTFEGRQFPPTFLTQQYGDEYGLGRKQIANALIGTYRDRMSERQKHKHVDRSFTGVDGQEYCYVLLQPGYACLDRRGPHPEGPEWSE